MMTAELDHPRLRGGRFPEQRQIELVTAEDQATAALRFPEHLVSLDDLQDLLVALRTQGRGQERQHRVVLGSGEIPEAQSLAAEDPGRKI